MEREEQLAAEVEAAAAEARREQAQRDEPPPPEPPEAPLELAEVAPRRRPVEPLRSPLEVRLMLMKLARYALVLLVLALLAGAFLTLTETGRGLLPPAMQREAKTLDSKARSLGEPNYYTFTDNEGVVHIVDDLEKVPAEHRAQAKPTLR